MNFNINIKNNSIQVSHITVNLPDHNSNEFSIFQDFVPYFGCETNYDTEVKIKKKAKEHNLKVSFDSEADNIGIYTKNPEKMFSLILLINELASEKYKIIFTLEEEEQLKSALNKWKRPKKQRWKEGDIFSIKLSNGSYAYAQIAEKYEGVQPVCVLFEGTYDELPELQNLLTKKIIALLSIVGYGLNDFTYKVIYSTTPVIKVPVPRKRDSVRYITYDDSTLIELAESFAGIKEWESNLDSMVIKDNLVPWLKASKI